MSFRSPAVRVCAAASLTQLRSDASDNDETKTQPKLLHSQRQNSFPKQQRTTQRDLSLFNSSSDLFNKVFSSFSLSTTPTPILCEEEPEYPFYTKAQVAEHTTPEKGIWMTYGEGVYDVTDFVANHPGGSEKLMLAAGKALDPFWRVYQQHFRTTMAMEILEKRKIGELYESEMEDEDENNTADPYDLDPADRFPGLLFHNTKPCNAELPSDLQLNNWITPSELWFIRHHHPVPHVDVGNFKVNVWAEGEGFGKRQSEYDFVRLQSKNLARQNSGAKEGEKGKEGGSAGVGGY